MIMSARNFILTQKELAQHLGVSQMTISRVLNNRPGVGPKLRKKVLEAIKKYNYIPNRIASGLVAGSTKIIGLIIPDITNSFFPEITKSIEKKAREKGYRVILAHSFESYKQECEEITLLLGFSVEGFIIAPSGKQNEIGIYRKLQSLKIPFVFIDRIKEGVKCSCVRTDIRKGAFLLGEYLIKKGYKKWGYLRGPKGISSSEEHFQGLKESLEGRDNSLKSITSVHAGFSEEDGYQAIQRLLDKVRVDVVIGVNDPVAIGAYKFLKEKGVRVPYDVALVGFSDIKSASILEASLTTVREPTWKIGEKAVEILIKEINNPEGEKQQIKLEPELIVRNSG